MGEASPDAQGVTPVLSVVIPAYNSATVLPEQLRAVAALEDLPSHEVIVVDNRSTDDTAAVAISMRELFDELRVVPAMDQAGTCYARNRGAEAATGDILLFVDADDLIAPTYLQHALGALDDVDVVGGQVVQFNDRGWNADGDYEFLEPRRVSGDVLAERSSTRLGWLPVVNHGGMVVRRSTFERIGGLDEQLTYGGDEPEFSFRLQTRGFSLAFAPEAIMYFRADPTDMGTKFKKSFSIGQSEVTFQQFFAVMKRLPTGMSPELTIKPKPNTSSMKGP